MNQEFALSFAPNNDDGSIDFRFVSHIEKIIHSAGEEVIQGLDACRKETTNIEKFYSKFAFKFAEAYLKEIRELEVTHSSDNQFQFKSKMMRKRLKEGLIIYGFKPSMISKIVGAAEFLCELKAKLFDGRGRRRKVIEQELKVFESLPLSSQYVFSLMNPGGRDQAICLSTEKIWNKETDEFDLRPLTQSDLEVIKRDYPKNPIETRGKKTLETKTEDKISSFAELTKSLPHSDEVPKTQYDIAKELISLAGRINTKEGYKDRQLIKILSNGKSELLNLSHLASLSI